MVTEQTTRTLTTSKGRSVTTGLSDAEAYRAVCGMNTEFARSLTRKALTGLSNDQVAWLHILATQDKPEARKIYLHKPSESWEELLQRYEYFDGDPNLTAEFRAKWEAENATNPVISKLTKIFDAAAKSSLKSPTIRLIVGDISNRREITLRCKNGVIYVADRYNEQYNSYKNCYTKIYYGKIDSVGFYPTRACPDDVIQAVLKFAEAPLEEAKNYGKITGSCCFCGKALTDAASIANGYGPVCATKYAL